MEASEGEGEGEKNWLRRRLRRNVTSVEEERRGDGTNERENQKKRWMDGVEAKGEGEGNACLCEEKRKTHNTWVMRPPQQPPPFEQGGSQSQLEGAGSAVFRLR